MKVKMKVTPDGAVVTAYENHKGAKTALASFTLDKHPREFGHNVLTNKIIMLGKASREKYLQRLNVQRVAGIYPELANDGGDS